VAIFPGEMEEFWCVEVGGFRAQEGFEAPLDVGAFPGLEAVAAGREPVELEEVPHERNVLRKDCNGLWGDEGSFWVG